MGKRSPSFAYFGEKVKRNTIHLSDGSFRLYHEIMIWMWASSHDGFSIPNDLKVLRQYVMPQWSKAKIKKCFEELQAPPLPVFTTRSREGGVDLVSLELKAYLEFSSARSRAGRAGGLASSKSVSKPEVRGVASFEQEAKQDPNLDYISSSSTCSSSRSRLGPEPEPGPAQGPNPLVVAASVLQHNYASLVDALEAAHPTLRLEPDLRFWDAQNRWARTLLALVHLDGFTVDDVVTVILWCLQDNHRDAVFWRKQVLSFGNLRQKTEGSDKMMTKFAVIHERWVEATKGPVTGPGAETGFEDVADPEVKA